MKQILFLFSTTVLFFTSFGQDKAEKLDELLRAYNNQSRFNGSVLIIKDGKTLLDKGYGFSNVEENIPNKTNTIFQIGSITKQFTAAVILKLQEENKINVDDKLSKYFPGYPNGDSITIEHLLTHTSGIYSYTNDREFMSSKITLPHSRQQMISLFKNKPLHFTPGTKWRYSNSGYLLLGYIIEDVTGLPYEQAVRKYIFNPLKMQSSGFDYTKLNNQQKATGYSQLVDEMNTPAPSIDSTISFASGSIYTTTADLYKFQQGMQTHAIISKSTLEKASTPFKNNYGYGFEIDSIAGKKIIGHSGSIHGFVSNLVWVPGENTVVILLNNVTSPHLGKITHSIISLLYDQPYELPIVKTAITVPEKTLEQYTGVYEIAPQFAITISLVNGALIGTPQGQESRILHPEKEDLFFLKEVDGQFKFSRNEQNEITEVTLFQGGKEIIGKRRK